MRQRFARRVDPLRIATWSVLLSMYSEENRRRRLAAAGVSEGSGPGGIVLGTKSALDKFDQYVNDLDVQLLNAIRELTARRANAHVRKLFQLGIRAPGQTDDRDSELSCLVRGLQYIRAGAAGAYGEQAIAGASVRGNVAGEDLLIAVIVRGTAQVTGIAYRDGGETYAILSIAAGKFFGEVHGIAHGTAVSARIDAALALQCLDHHARRLLDLIQRGPIAQ